MRGGGGGGGGGGDCKLQIESSDRTFCITLFKKRAALDSFNNAGRVKVCREVQDWLERKAQHAYSRVRRVTVTRTTYSGLHRGKNRVPDLGFYPIDLGICSIKHIQSA